MTNPKAGSPFGLWQQTLPRVRAEAGHVIVRLELVSLRDRTDVFDIEIVLEPGVSAPLGFELIEATKKIQ